MNDASFKPSLGLESILGPDIAADSEGFLLFLKAYYEWLQSTKITLTDISGTFVRGEEIVGDTSGAKAKIEEVGDGYIVVRVTSRIIFNNYEDISGQTSSATATVATIKDNVVRESGNLVNYRNLETSIDQYVDYLHDELYHNIPTKYFGDKRLIATKFRSFFESRSNEDSYRFLFKLLYNEDIDFYYPGEDILRVSDGNFEKTQIIRVAVTSDIFEFLNKNIRGTTTNYFANVVDIKTFFINNIEIAELTLKFVSGTFQAGETIVVVDDATLTTTIYGIVAGFTINDGGSGYQVGDEITITGDGAEAQAVVSSIKQSPITALKVNTIGHGYRLDTTATINNTGTGGTGLIVRVTELANTYTVTNANTGNTYTVGEVSEVSIINRGSNYFAAPSITLKDTTIESLGLLSDKLITITNPGTNYHVGDSLVITANTGANAVGQIASVTANASFSNTLLFEDGFEILFEQSYDDVAKVEDWDLGSYGPIARVEFTNFGDGYSALYPPTITVNTSSGASAVLTVNGVQGMSANVEVDTANNVTGIGSIRAVEISNFGIDYTSANADATAVGDGNANLTPVISGVGVSEGKWIDDDGKIDYKIIQDSYYYQDYSYVIKSGLTVEKYVDTIKKSIHPAGLQVFGEILLIDNINVTPELKSLIETIKDFIVRIYDFVTVAPTFDEFKITIETTIESFIQLPVAIIPNADIATHEYIIQVVAGGDDLTNIIDNTVTPYREIRVIAPSEFNSEMEVEIAPIRKLIVTYAQIFDAYSEITYGDLKLLPYADMDISEWASITFGTRFGEIPFKFGEYIVKLVPGGGDNTFIEDLTVQTFRRQNFILELYWNAAATVLISDIQTEQTGTREVEIDSITFLNAESDFIQTEFVPKYNLGPFEVVASISQEYSILIESLGFANAEFTMIIAFSSVTPQKLQTAENLVFAYGTTFADMYIDEIAGDTFESYIPENEFIYQIKDRPFTSVYRSSPRSFKEYIVTYQNVDATTVEMSSKEVVVKTSSGMTYELWSSIQISELSSTQLQQYEDVFVGGLKGFVEGGTSIPTSPSQWPLGQNPSKVEITDTFFKEYELSISHEKYANYGYDGIRLELFADAQLSSLASTSITDEYDSIPISNYIDKYNKIVGTISFQTDGANTIILGSGTNFSSDFAISDRVVANNELFIVESISNTTYMTVDRQPTSMYSNIFAYKQI